MELEPQTAPRASRPTSIDEKLGVSASSFHGHRLIAKGGFSRCELALHRVTGGAYALKCQKLKVLAERQSLSCDFVVAWLVAVLGHQH